MLSTYSCTENSGPQVYIDCDSPPSQELTFLYNNCHIIHSTDTFDSFKDKKGYVWHHTDSFFRQIPGRDFLPPFTTIPVLAQLLSEP
jgi:hypothetical protein